MRGPEFVAIIEAAMIKAVFFDLYGTLAGFSPSRFEIQSAACSAFGIEVTSEGILRGYALADAYMSEQNTYRPLRLRNAAETEEFFGEYERLVLRGAGVDVSRDRALAVWRRVRRARYELTRFGDVLPTLETLRSRGLTLGMISNINRPSAEMTAELGLSEHLDFAVTSVEVGAEKPHPPIFLAALERAGSEPGEALHVGDQLSSDVEGARGVGIGPVLLDRDCNHRGYAGCPRIESLSELPALLARG